MLNAKPSVADKVIRGTSTLSVIILAGIAAVISYRHMYHLVFRYEEGSWTAALLPISVDGIIAVASMSLLVDSRQGRRSGLLPWTLLVLGSAASLAANGAVAEPSVVGRSIAAWPSCALIGAYELLMRQVRNGSQRESSAVSYRSPHRAAEKADASYWSHASLTKEEDASYDALMSQGNPPDGPYDAQTSGAASFIRNAYEVSGGEDPGEAKRAHPRRGRPVSGLQRQAWQWALAHRTAAGELPSGKTIEERFGRRERWGRLVKQAGATGRLDLAVTP
ncbi:DUF2637 domain-containing protein [Actinomadura decatromicini]|uniref:DUF2637 domain-containing protein n=1 Tax=Actinomadura decatromicini TaxID=2604572 RepID=A0A5D3FSS7_9ACTN|nr:DUF2637 domain-containing protein [Actinomadura decatromicini]TYK51072.1 DUF2637 domain-containing protein [Actinomadura decatromicini]